MSSIALGFGVKLKYRPLKMLEVKELTRAKKIVLLVIDGLGAEFLKRNAEKEGFFMKNKVGEITSVFPSTTTAAVPSFMTGEAPQNHGLVSWYMNIKELGGAVRVLPWTMRQGGEIGVKAKEFFKQKTFSEKIKVPSYTVIPRKIVGSEFNEGFNKGVHQVGYNSLRGMFYQINKLIKKKGRRYIHAYWPEFDTLVHRYGAESRKVGGHFKEIERELERFAKKLEGKGAVLLVTADHGLVTHVREDRVDLNKHPKLRECLACAMGGEPRVIFCHVLAGKERQFEKYVREKLRKYCELYKSKELVDKGLFGLGKGHAGLLDRIGNYTLVAKKNYILRERLVGEKIKLRGGKKGDHGGLSKEEMMVPLIMVGG